MLIDFHTHVFPDAIAERTVSVLTEGIRREQGADYHQGEPLAFRPATLDGLRESMHRFGVDKSICLPIATRPDQTAGINRFAEKIRDAEALSLGALHPADPDWEKVLENLAERGFRGIKLHLEFQQTDIDSPQCLRILKKAESLGLLTVFHAGADIGLPPPVHATPEKIRHVLTEVEGSHLIAAHLGGWGMWDDVEKFLIGTPILLDTAFIREFLPPKRCLSMVRAHGMDKVLFGSDSPWENPADTLSYLLSAGFTEREMEQICFRNAQRLLQEEPLS